MTEPKYLEKEIRLEFDGQFEATEQDFCEMLSHCNMNATKPALVVDAEGSYVCIAPEKIARLIAKLLNECKELDD